MCLFNGIPGCDRPDEWLLGFFPWHCGQWAARYRPAPPVGPAARAVVLMDEALEFPLHRRHMPEAACICIHPMLDLGGAVRFGPDVEWIETSTTLSVVLRKQSASTDKACRIMLLAPSFCARPKVIRSANPSGPGIHGMKGFWNLFGIGLTSSSCDRVGAFQAERT